MIGAVDMRDSHAPSSQESDTRIIRIIVTETLARSFSRNCRRTLPPKNYSEKKDFPPLSAFKNPFFRGLKEGEPLAGPWQG